MGGNAIKNTFVRRFARHEYKVLEYEVLQMLRAEFMDVASQVRVVPHYSTKPSFGDMDIVIDYDLISQERIDKVREKIRKIFGANEIYYNNREFSFPYKEIQVDLICVSPAYYRQTIDYLSYNDLGCLVGVIAKYAFGLSYGMRGLIYKCKADSGEALFEKELRKNSTAEILDFLGFDGARFNQGFDTLESIFEYVCSSKHFHESFFELTNLNNENRTRNRKRDNYMKFLEYCKGKSSGIHVPDMKSAILSLPEFAVAKDCCEFRKEKHRIAKKAIAAAKDSCILHYGGGNHSRIAAAMKFFREVYGDSPSISEVEAAQFIFKNISK